jgi:UDP-N-acetyl-2-amino-2-deoxyglucuronate dehydrogenase
MKYALIGCGRIAINHMKAAHNNQLDIIACCDINSEHLDALLKKCTFETDKIKRYSDYKEMIKDNRLDLVAIATESGKHAEIALYCISHGINVIIEKPIAMSMEDADKIVASAAAKNVKVCVCHQNRFNQAVTATKKAIAEGRLGKISHASICVRWNRDKNYYDQAPWRGTWVEDGGTLMNQCIHGIDLLLYLVGSPAKLVYGQTRQQFHDYLEAEDVGMGLVSFENGAIGTIEGTVNVFPKNLEETLYLFGETGTVKIGGTSTNKIEVWDFKDCREEDDAIRSTNEATSNVYGNGHTALYADMIEAIKNNRSPLVSGIEGKKALEIVLSIYKSEKTGEAISLPNKKFSSLDMKGIFGK